MDSTYLVMGLLTPHVLSGVFWAGSTWATANLGGPEGIKLFPFQFGAGLSTIVTGSALWALSIKGPFYLHEQILLAGIVTAAVALLIQIVVVWPAKKLARSGPPAEVTVAQVAKANRAAAGLLSLTVASMIIAKFF